MTGNISQQNAKYFFKHTAELLFTSDGHGRFVELSSRWTQVLGWSRQELTSRPFIEFVHPDDQKATLAEAELLRQGRATIDFENRYQCKDGTWRWLSWRASRRDENSTIIGTACDITERKNAEIYRDTHEEINAMLVEGADLRELLPRIVEVIGSRMGWDLAAIWLPERSTQRLVSEATWGSDPLLRAKFEGINSSHPLRSGQGIPGVVMETGQARWSTDLATDPILTRLSVVNELNVHSLACVPIRTGSTSFGVIEVCSILPHRIEQSLRLTLEALGHQIGQFIHNYRVSRRLTEAHARQLNDIVLREVHAAEFSLRVGKVHEAAGKLANLGEIIQGAIDTAVASLTGGLSEAAPVSLPVAPVQQARVVELTVREKDVLHLLERHLSNREIGKALGISVDTVKAHVANIRHKFGVNSRMEAVAEAARQGILPSSGVDPDLLAS